jgi:FkbM family methyltransferase
VTEAPIDNGWLEDFQLEFWECLNPAHRVRLENLLPFSNSQLYQDLFVLTALGFPRRGYFVEVGAADGVSLSNTLLLERFGWRGILSEPARTWSSSLLENRRGIIDNRAVWSHTGETLVFKETNPPELSTLKIVNPSDMHQATRENSSDYEVASVSLRNLLEEHGAPREIDFISIDAEGAELEILQAFDFNQFDVKVMCLEHNFTGTRSKLQALMGAVGFARVTKPDTLFDDWFIHSSIAESCGFRVD